MSGLSARAGLDGPKLVYSVAYEGLFQRALGARLGPAERDALRREVQLDLDKPLNPSYSFEHWLQSIEVVIAALMPDWPVERSWNHLGRLLVTGYQTTLVGRATLSLARLVGPRRALQRTVQTFKTGCNYIETRLDELGPTEYRLWVNEVGPHPEFTQGTLQAGLEVSGAQEPVVNILQHHEGVAFYEVKWKAA